MKSRTSYFNKTLFRKNLTRFAPAWAVYSIALLLFFTSFAGNSSEYVRCMNAADMAPAMALINLCYAFVLAQLLFGDLFTARMCNMLHAMPLRRETIYGTNVVTALTCSLVPNALYALIQLPFLGSGWVIAPYWFAASAMQFLFFFGTAMFSVMLSGNRLAMSAVYVLVNFLSLLLLWFSKTLFAPLLFGIRVISDPFYLFCPAYKMMEFYQLIDVHRASDQLPVSTGAVIHSSGEITNINVYDGPSSVYETGEYVTVTTGAGWGYLAICAVIGIVLMVIALQLYRRRRLESAGDFMAVKAAEPVFLVLFTLGVGAFFQLFAEMFGTGSQYFFLAGGIVVGFFASLMLLRKTTRVFQLKAFRNLGILGASIALILVLTWLDPLGFSLKVPEAEDVESVTFGTSYASSETIWNDMTLTETEDIQAIIDVHRYAVGELHENLSIEGNSVHYAEIGIEYQLKDGSVLSRYYSIPILSSAGETLRMYSSSVECVTQMSEEEFRALENKIYNVYSNYNSFAVQDIVETLDMGALLDAVITDCKAGNMAQEWDYHHQYEDSHVGYLQLDYVADDGFEYGIGFDVYETCTNTLRWMEENGLYQPNMPNG